MTNHEYRENWAKENTERIVIKPNNKYHLSERIQTQVIKGNAKSRQDFIICAVLEKLEKLEGQSATRERAAIGQGLDTTNCS